MAGVLGLIDFFDLAFGELLSTCWEKLQIILAFSLAFSYLRTQFCYRCPMRAKDEKGIR